MARVAVARRELLLNVHRHRLRREDLEDCYSQATLELLSRARTGPPLHSPGHIANALEQKLLSRIADRRRALAGRSPIEAALRRSAALDDPASDGLADASASVPERVERRMDLGRVHEVARELTSDQRLVLACQVGADMSSDEFCRRYGWTPEKFRKVAQRARQRLVRLIDEYGSGQRCRRLEPDLIAYVSQVAEPDQRARATSHLANCASCRLMLRELQSVERRVAAMAPLTAAVGFGARAGAATAGGAAGGAAAASAAGGGGVLVMGGVGALKAGLAALCIAGLTGSGLLLCHGPSGALTVRAAAALHRRVAARTGSAQPRRPDPVTPQRPGGGSPPERSAPRSAPQSPATAQATREFGLPLLGQSQRHVVARHRPGGPRRHRTARAAFSPGVRMGVRARRRPASSRGPAPPLAIGFER